MKKLISAVICVVFLLNLISSPIAQGNNSQQVIRVKIASMGEPQQLVVELHGAYQLKEDDELILTEGSYKLSYTIDGIKMIMPNGQTSQYKTVTFQPLMDQSFAIMNNTSYGVRVYLNQLSFSKTTKGIQVINTINIEQYLYGVLPAMMNEDWEAEALKAQAVVARTYAIGSIQPLAVYDVTDTEEYQAYLGFLPNQTTIMQAIDTTQNEVLKFGNKYAEAYSTLSNGGEIESSEAAWHHVLPYSVNKKDEYDINHEDNQFANWTSKVNKEEIDSYLAQKIMAHCEEALIAKGYKVNEQNIAVQQIKAIDLLQKTKSDRLKLANITVSIKLINDENKEYLLDVTFSLDNEAFKQMFNIVSDRVSGDELADAFMLYGRGYGHGVGLSRYGADQMAKEGHAYEEILEYYYPSTYLYQMTPEITPKKLPHIKEWQETYNPFEAIVNKNKPLFGFGTINNEKDVVEVRQGPGKQYEVIDEISDCTRVAVYKAEGDWLHILAGTITGYVKAIDVDMDDPIETQNKVPKKQAIIQDYVVYDALPPEDDKRLRVANWIQQGQNSGPSTKNHLAGMSEVIWLVETVNEEGLEENNQDQNSTINDESEQKEYKQIRKTTVAVCTDLLNIRKQASINSEIIGQVTGGSKLIAIGEQGNWLAIEQDKGIAFVDKSYVELINIPVEYLGNNKYELARVAVDYTNLRQYPNHDGVVINQLHQGRMVEVLNEFALWCYVKDGTNKGYVHNAYLIFEKTSM